MELNGDPGTVSEGLHSFVKLAVAYLGIMAGFGVLGLVFYVISATGEAAGSTPVHLHTYSITIGFFLLLIGISLMALWQLIKGKRLGVYLAFASLIISVLAPYSNQTAEAPLMPIYWIAIPNAVVGILLLRALKTLR